METIGETSDVSRAVTSLVFPQDAAPILVYSSVLPWIGSKWHKVTFAAGAFQAALSAQIADWSRLRARFPDARLCVLGDLNQDLASRHSYGSSANRRALASALDAPKCDGPMRWLEVATTPGDIAHLLARHDLGEPPTPRPRGPPPGQMLLPFSSA